MFDSFGSFAIYIVGLTVIAILSIIYEKQLIEIEDKVRYKANDYFNKVRKEIRNEHHI